MRISFAPSRTPEAGGVTGGSRLMMVRITADVGPPPLWRYSVVGPGPPSSPVLVPWTPVLLLLALAGCVSGLKEYALVFGDWSEASTVPL